MSESHRSTARRVARAGLPVVGAGLLVISSMIVVYAVLPVPEAEASPWLLVGAAAVISVVYLGAAAWSVVLIHRSFHPMRTGGMLLLVMVTAMVIIFSLSYLALSTGSPSNFTEPLDKIDALYFTMTILTTVGFGDITAQSSVARVAVMVQMVVSVTLITALGKILIEVARRETRRRMDSA